MLIKGVSHPVCASLISFHVNHCSLTFSDIITPLTRNSEDHFPGFSPQVSLLGEVNYLIIFLKGAIKCALNIWDALKATSQTISCRVTLQMHLERRGLFLSFFAKIGELQNDTTLIFHHTDWFFFQITEIESFKTAGKQSWGVYREKRSNSCWAKKEMTLP